MKKFGKSLKDFKNKNKNTKFDFKINLNDKFHFEKFKNEELNQTISERFEKIVAKYPEKNVIKINNEIITYKELNEASNLIGRNIMKMNIDSDGIALLFEQSIEMVKGMLGVLKTGKFYVALDPEYPIKRIKYMINNSKIKIILTNKNNLNLAKKFYEIDNEIKIINIDEIDLSLENNNLNLSISPSSYAYVLYTSGSTGNPKGVIQSHRNVLHFIRAYTNNLKVCSEDKLTLFSSYSFDAAVIDIYSTILNGAELFPYNIKKEEGLENLAKWLIDEKITIFHSIPTLYRYFIESISEENNFTDIRLVVLGGEAVYKNDVESYKKYFNNDCIFVNLLGQSESSFTLQNFIDKKTIINKETVSVGYPVTETEVILITEENKEAEIFEIGELVYRSEYLALGYLNDKEKTDEVFTLDPISKKGRVYRTGDLGRKLPNGTIEFVGRKDFQVKIRGYRVELGEVESVFDRIPGISKSVLLCYKNNIGENFLTGYYVKDNKEEIDLEKIKLELKKDLPDYFVPSVFFELEELPLTPSGKIDRKSLPEPTEETLFAHNKYIAPETEIEKKLEKIWHEILNVEKIGIIDNFFELGGHSLKATLLISRIHKELELELPLIEVFNRPTIKEEAEYLENINKSNYINIEKLNDKKYYNLSSAQKRMYLLNQFEPDSVNYNITVLNLLEGKLDLNKIENSFRELLKRHKSLTTQFLLVEGKPVQKIVKEINFNIEYKEVDESNIKEELSKIKRPFDLKNAPLFRVCILKLNENKHILFVEIHHIVSDGTSLNILVSDFIKLYNGNTLEELKLQYVDYAEWQNSEKVKESLKVQEKYWENKFLEEIPVLDMPLDFKRPKFQSFEGAELKFEISKGFFGEIKELVKRENITLNILLLTALNILLHKYTGQEDIVIGSPISGRSNADTHKIVGMFVNTLALRNYPVRDKSLREFLEEVKNNSLLDYQNQDYQFEELVEKLDIKRDLSRNPLFDIVLNTQNFSENIDVELDKLKVSFYEIENNSSKFDITLNAFENNDHLEMSFNYCKKLFKEETMFRMKEHFKNILKSILENIDSKIKEIKIITDEEEDLIVNNFNDTKADYPKDKNIIQLFNEQVKLSPNNIALVYKKREITYKELNEKSEKLAMYLIEKGIQQNEFVCLMIDNSIEFIISMLGVLKCGACYVPIDPKYPQERINYILDDTKSKLLLINRENKNEIKLENYIFVEDILEQNIISERQLPIYSSENKAYVIYTSGTTGQPKGVLIKHSSLVNFCFWMKNEYHINDTDKVSKYAGVGFDASVLEIFPYLIKGAAIHILSEEVKYNLEKLVKYYNENRITISFLLPQVYESFLEYEVNDLRLLIIGGDKLKKFKSKNYKIYNNYGPTENTVVATNYLVEKLEDNIPIGKPISNNRIYILDKENMLQAIGIPGELCILGDGLSIGYYNKEKLTKEKFVNFNNETMYKTGDLARWRSDGNIEFLGRIDSQVKIRGFRIELGEIESAILNFNGIKETVVLSRENGDENYLCAYLLLNNEVQIEELKKYLSEKLPKYMIPTYFIIIDEIPLTRNGKINIKLLPNPDYNDEINVNYIAPSSELEIKLSLIWKEILKVEKIGVDFNFFDLGGHSLKATLLVSNIFRELGLEISLVEVFNMPTIKEQAKLLELKKKQEFKEIKKVFDKEYYKLSSAQKRMYLLNQFDTESINYNITLVNILEGKLDIQKLEESFKKLILRHKVLRTKLELREGEVVQKILKNVEFKIELKETSEEKLKEEISYSIKPFDLKKAPLMRVKIFKLKEEKNILFIDMHHIISDGISLNILISDFVELYKEKELKELKIDYVDYAEWQNSKEVVEELKEQEKFWVERFEEEIPVLDLLTDYKRPKLKTFNGKNIPFEIIGEELKVLKTYLREKNITLNMLLLSALNILLYKYTGQEDIAIGTPVSGRARADLKNIVGMFVNTLVHRNYPDAEKTINEFVKEVKDRSLEDYSNQDYQYEELLENLKIKRDLSRNPLFDVMINVQNFNEFIDVDLGDVRVNQFEIENKIAKFDLTLSVFENEEKINLSLNYAEKLFKKETIERMKEHFKKILKAILENVDSKIKDIKIITEKEENLIVNNFNDTKADYPKDKNIIQLFNEQVKLSPDNIALVYKKNEITYKELNEKSEKLAMYLIERGIQQNEFVCLMMDNSIEFIISMLGVLKCGACYVPIDPKYPQERINYILEDTKSKILLINRENKNEIKLENYIFVEDILEQNILRKRELPVYSSENKAYVIYTSGTTGQPKGVVIKHSSLVNSCFWTNNDYDVKASDKVAKYAGVGFDASVLEIFPYLIKGATIHILSEEVKYNLEKLVRYYNENKITVSFLPPQVYESFLEYEVSDLRLLIIGGDKLKKFKLKNYKIYNNYGPTENTVVATNYLVEKLEDNIPIGKPISNNRIYILDKENMLQAIGIPGELCILGDGLSIGYHNKEKLTKEKFVNFNNETMYKTGDLARWRSDGNIEFLGRIDRQVKIRGFRIELGEIESTILNFRGIKETVVLSRENGDENYLCAYLILKNKVQIEELKRYLSEKLPQYMIPAYFIIIEEIPLTRNGKINVNLLANPDYNDGLNANYIAPSSELEIKLSVIWQEILKIEKIGIDFNFFDLGGHSLKATLLVSRIFKELGLEISLVEIFNMPTIKEQAKYLESSNKLKYISIEKIKNKNKDFNLSFSQNMMYLLNQLDSNSLKYNIFFAVELEGKIVKDKINEAINKVIKRHEALRTYFEVIDDKPVQNIKDNVEFKLKYIEKIEGDEIEFINKHIEMFDLSKAPLIKGLLIKKTERKFILLMNIHHIICDGISREIIINDFVDFYNNKKLDELKLQYKDFSEWQHSEKYKQILDKQEKYWLEKYSQKVKEINFPTDFSLPESRKFSGSSERFKLEENIYKKLEEISKKNDTTIFIMMLASLYILIYKYTLNDDIVIGLPVSGRTKSELEKIVGVFINSIAVRVKVDSEIKIKDFLSIVKKEAINAYDNQDYPFDKLVDKLKIKRDLNRNPLYNIMVNYLKSEEKELTVNDFNVKHYRIDSNYSKMDFEIYISDINNTLGFNIQYSTELFKKETIIKIYDDLLEILKYIIDKNDFKISDIELISKELKEEIINDFNEDLEDFF